MSVPPIRIAMWSGPRNISTAMMRAFENRPDTSVSDEPFYAAYLHATGLDHPMRREILDSQPVDARAVVASITGPVPGGRHVWYQKHMTHHMRPGFDRGWIDKVANAFLLRSPVAVLASYVEKRNAVCLDDIGLPQQLDIFSQVADRLGHAPPVLDGEDVLRNPHRALDALCRACGIPFDASMLRWPAGPRTTDGVWAPAWYDKVIETTGFGSPRRSLRFDDLDPALQRVAEAAQPFYEQLFQHRLVIDPPVEQALRPPRNRE